MRISLRLTLFYMTLIGVYCGLFSLPHLASFLSLLLLSFVAPSVFVAGVVYGRGALRTFAIGCVAGAVPMVGYLCRILLWVSYSLRFGNSEQFLYLKTSIVVAHAIVAVSGFLLVICRWLLKDLPRMKH